MNCLLCKSQDTSICYTDENNKTYYKCNNCKLIFLSPKNHLKEDKEKERYDLHKNSPNDEGYIQFLNKLLIPLKKNLKKGFIGLDYGCGPGPTVSEILKSESVNVYNYDPFYFPDKNLLNKKYDFVTCTEVAEHFHSPHNEFQLLKSLLKNTNSHLGIMTEILLDETNFNSWWYKNDPTHVCFYQKETLIWIATWLNLKADFPAKNVVIYSTTGN